MNNIKVLDDHRPFIKVQLKETEFIALADTGASLSFIGEKVKNWTLEKGEQLHPLRINTALATGGKNTEMEGLKENILFWVDILTPLGGRVIFEDHTSAEETIIISAQGSLNEQHSTKTTKRVVALVSTRIPQFEQIEGQSFVAEQRI